MSNLKDQIIADLTAAMKAREGLKTSTLRMLKAAIMNYEVSGANKVTTDEVVTDLIKKSIKQRRESAESFEKGGNREAAEKEGAEARILETYLPEQMSEEDIRKVVEGLAKGAGPGDFGRVMGAVMGKLKGKADGAAVSRIVKEVLG